MIDPLFTLPGVLKALLILVVIVALDVTHVLITATQRIVPGRHRASRESYKEGVAPQFVGEGAPGRDCREQAVSGLFFWGRGYRGTR